MRQAIDRLVRHIDCGNPGYVCVTDVNALLHARRNPELRRIFNGSTLTVPDGMPLVWAGKSAGADWMGRVCGPDLMPALLSAAAERGWSSYFLGGAPQVAEEMIENLRRTIPGLKVAGWQSPPFRELSPEEETAMVQEINDSGARIVWVGLGAPKQENWMDCYRSRLGNSLLVGVGGAFDMHAGRVRRAPRWMQRGGLEWVYRFAQEPRRLWKRYTRNVPVFILALCRRAPKLVESA
ncbi:WecB/TagA/CpsF family glycosyltransferase [Arthrobacter sp. C9C5]|uniref:WecB/TagA/CpsF family glycosyltransferase n=1 Tax=Arthrobacter sp. C9C5 TaxID=2735267 RepID=UPI001C2F1FD8|nr:WecB/TagA/CpsF family glycosyltransferase [Arthrobacter sp. C9C5]